MKLGDAVRSSVAAIAGLALCLPCVLVLLVGAGIGISAFSAFGAWFTDSILVLGAAGVTAVAFAALAWATYQRRARGAACEVDPAEEKLTWSRREPSASTPRKPTVAGGD